MLQISTETEPHKIKKFWTMRNQIMHKIRRVQIETKEAELDAKVTEIARFTDTTKVYHFESFLSETIPKSNCT